MSWILPTSFFLSILIFFSSVVMGIRPVTQQEKLMLFGKNLRLGVVETPPYARIKHAPNGTIINVDGYVNDIIEFLANKYKFTFEYVEPSDGGNIGSCFNDTCNGLVGMLARREIDVIACGITITRSRSLHIDFTYEIQIDALSLLITRPHQEATIGRITLPFQYDVWILILASIAVCAYGLFLIFRCESYWLAKMHIKEEDLGFIPEWTFGDYLVFLLPILISSGNQLPSKNGIAFRILLTAWCLACVVITNSYNTSIKSYLVSPRYRPSVNTLDELVQSPDYLFVVQKYNSIWGEMMTATSGSFLDIGNSLRQHPENSLSTLDNVNDMIVYQKKILGQARSQNLYRISEDYKATGDCRLYLGDDFGESHVALAVQKDFTAFSNLLSHELMLLRESGLLAYWTKYSWPKENRCSIPIASQQSGVTEKLSVNYLIGVFTVLGCGLMASFIAFVFELLVYHFQRSRYSKSHPQIGINTFL